MDPQATSYDELPYESYPFAWTHPDRLATIARLLGVQPPPVDHCRVLELGCAAGGNVIPMALGLPHSTFVGIDLSRRQIADGQAVIAALGLKNVELRHLDILDVSPELGPVDYLICHGVYSWVATPVQDKILEICARHLTPAGVAYVSYNTYPGWHTRRLVRDMLVYHAHRFPDARTRVGQARAFLDFLTRWGAPPLDSVFPSLVQGAAETFRQKSDTYLLHEYLEEVNEPVYFHEFTECAAARGLHYLGDAKLGEMRSARFGPAVEQILRQVAPDRIQREQYLDFLRNQSFRRSLLCHAGIVSSHEPQPENLATLYVASPAQPVAPGAGQSPVAEETFRGPAGTLTVSDPLLRGLLLHLAEVWPEAVAFEQLGAAARTRLSLGAEPDPAAVARQTRSLAEGLLAGYLEGLVELHTCQLPCVRAGSERPVASPLARYQAASTGRVTNLRQELVQLDDLDRRLVRHLDGSHDRSALAEVLGGVPGESLELHLSRFARFSLLVG